MSNQNQSNNQSDYDYQINLNFNQAWLVVTETEKNPDGSISQTLEIIKREVLSNESIKGEFNHE